MSAVKTPAKIPRKRFLDEGAYPIISQEADFINGFWDVEDDVIHLDRPIVVFGDHTRVVKYVDFDFVVGADGVKLFQPKPFVDPRYFYYFLLGHPVQTLGYARHYRLLKELEVCYPPLAEQKRIVAILDEAFEAIAVVTANAERNLANARELFESRLHAVFTQRGDGWEMKPLGEACDNLDSKRVPITKKDRKPGDIPYYGASGIVDYVADYIFDEDLLLVSEDGANLLARTYPIAFSISDKTWVNNHAHVLRFDNVSSQVFVEYYLNSISLAPYVSGMAQPKLNQKALSSIPIPFPDVQEQQDVVETLDAMGATSKQLSSLCQRKLVLFAELKQSILQKAFTGTLTADSAEPTLVGTAANE